MATREVLRSTAARPGRPPAGEPPRERYRPPYLAAGIAAAAVFVLYALTLAPTTWFWDTSEYITTSHILGIPHPPGNPLFVVLARAWEVLLSVTALPVAVRINLFSATMTALAHGCWFLLVHRILSYYGEGRRLPLLGAVLAVLVSASAFTVWFQSNVNEKVYTVSLFTIALLSWLIFLWRDHLGEGKDDNLLLLIVFILALSVGNHLMAFLAAPALVVFILLVAPRTLMNWKLYAAALVAVFAGLSIHLYLPLRAALDPIINEADPTCGSIWQALGSILSFGRAGCEELSAALAREQYDKPSIFASPLDPRLPRDASLLVAQIINYVQYFDWQWARSLAGNDSLFGGLRPLVTAVFAVIGSYGAWTHYQKDRTSWAYLALLFVTLSLGLVFYLNFKYGYSYADWERNRELHEVRERDYFFIVGFSVWGLWAGLGIATLWHRLTEGFAERMRSVRRARLLTAPVLAIALVPLLLNFSWANRRHDYSARDWAYNLLMSVEPYGVLFTNGDNDTFPLWYLQEVEGIRQDVTVIVMSYLNTPWYVRQLQALTTPCAPGQEPSADPTRIRCQRPFEPAEAPPFYQVALPRPDQPGQPVPAMLEPGRRPPTRSIIALSDAQIDQIAGTPPFLTRDALVFRAGELESTVSAGDLIIPSDIFMTAIITNAIEDRPIYFATTTQAYQELNLAPFLVRQGVAFKLHNGRVQPDSAHGIYASPETPLLPIVGPYIDLPRTDSLLWHVFMHRGGIPDQWGKWVDPATQGIPHYYGYTHYAAAQIHAVLGRDEELERHLERAQAWIELGEK